MGLRPLWLRRVCIGIGAVSTAIVVFGAILGALAAMTPCDSDDGAGQIACNWDASAQGEEGGEPFVALFDGAIFIS